MSSKDLEVIERGLVLSAQSFNDENINKTWRTQVRKMDGETVSAFSKLIPPREIFIEAVCAYWSLYWHTNPQANFSSATKKYYSFIRKR